VPQVTTEVPQDPYVAARAEVEPMTLQAKGVDSTKAPSRPTIDEGLPFSCGYETVEFGF